MTDPRPRSTMPGRKRPVRSTTASMLSRTIPTMRSGSLRGESPREPKPALLTSTSTTRPPVLHLVDHARRARPGRRGRRRSPRPSIPCSSASSVARLRSRSSRRATRISAWPLAASSRAIATPMPDEAPVTSAVPAVEGAGSPIAARARQEALAGLADERDGLGEDHADRVAHLLGLLVGRAGQVHRGDRRGRHVDGELDRVVGPGDLLGAGHLLLHLLHAAAQLLRVAEQSSESAFHATDDRHEPRDPRHGPRRSVRRRG